MEYAQCVEDALLVTPPAGTAPKKVHDLYAALKSRLHEYELSVVASQSMEGISHTKSSPEEAGRKVCIWLNAYRRALADSGAGTDPILSSRPMGHGFKFSSRPVPA
ncbi:MAG: hypothetical protein DVB22_003302 [Verrucomicrobia bacterium]|nr:MAG: hypothetical protein DVB22_003302 [Verrucomicrobiota bacterium]